MGYINSSAQTKRFNQKEATMNANHTYLDCLETQRQARDLRGDLLSIGYAIAALPLTWAAVYIAFI